MAATHGGTRGSYGRYAPWALEAFALSGGDVRQEECGTRTFVCYCSEVTIDGYSLPPYSAKISCLIAARTAPCLLMSPFFRTG